MNGYDETKDRECISCGTMTTVTKFMSDLKVQCDRCKTEHRAPNPDIVARIQSNNGKKSTSSVSGNISDKKPSKCTQCGRDMMIGKFASHKTALCDECKGVPSDDEYSGQAPALGNLKVDISKINKDLLPSMDEMYIMPHLISNHNLREVKCPACDHKYMKIIKVIDSSPDLGLVMVYQCTKCLTAITLSEQCKSMMKPSPMHRTFNYRAEAIMELSNTLQDVRARNAIEYLLRIVKEHDIEVPGLDLPEQIKLYREREKSMPIGIDDQNTEDNNG